MSVSHLVEVSANGPHALPSPFNIVQEAMRHKQPVSPGHLSFANGYYFIQNFASTLAVKGLNDILIHLKAFHHEICFREVVLVNITLSEEIAHPTVYHHLSQLSVDIQLNGLINPYAALARKYLRGTYFRM